MCLRVGQRLFGEAERRRLGRAGFSLHHQGRRREDGDWREREGRELVSRLQLAVIDVSVQMMIVRQISTLF